MVVETELRPARSNDREYVESLLTANDLPVADLPDDPEWLYCWVVGGERVGVGGLERYGDEALMRSVAIEEGVRGEGRGRALCERLLAEAAAAGVEHVYLLTTTAPGFFASLGFAEVERESAPRAIRESAEFDELCPDAAICMTRAVEQ